MTIFNKNIIMLQHSCSADLFFWRGGKKQCDGEAPNGGPAPHVLFAKKKSAEQWGEVLAPGALHVYIHIWDIYIYIYIYLFIYYINIKVMNFYVMLNWISMVFSCILYGLWTILNFCIFEFSKLFENPSTLFKNDSWTPPKASRTNPKFQLF